MAENTFMVYGDQCHMEMAGDRLEERRAHEMSSDGCAWLDGPFRTLEDAMAAGQKWLADEEPCAAHDNGNIGYVTWSEFTVFEETPDGGDAWSVDGGSNLDPGVRAAFDRAKAGYYAYLDYESDSYGTVTDYVEE